MDLQELLTNAVAAKRAKKMKTSAQLTVGELILKLETVKTKTLPVWFSHKEYRPTGINSWRGAYCELALGYAKDVDNGPFNTVDELILLLKRCIGKTFEGYKGGDFLMGKTTPIWVANYGEASGFESNKNYDDQAIIDVIATKKGVCLITELIEY